MAEAIPVVKVPGGLGESPTGQGLQLPGPLNEAAPVSLASASTVDLGAAAANTVNITGSVTINSWGTARAGIRRATVFGAALTIFYNATSMILPGGVNLLVAAGETVEWLSLGAGNWRCLSRASTSVPMYDSGWLDVTASSSITLTHALGVVPNEFRLFLRAKTANNGYSIGDEAPIPHGTDHSGSTVAYGSQIQEVGTTTLKVATGTTLRAAMIPKSGGAVFSPNVADWQLKVLARRVT